MGLVAWFKQIVWPSVRDMRVKVSDLQGIVEAIDTNQDGYITVGEIIDEAIALGVRL